MLLPPRWVYWAVFRANAYKIPFIAKINHNELHFPQSDQVMFGSEQAWNLGVRQQHLLWFRAINPPDSGSAVPLPRP